MKIPEPRRLSSGNYFIQLRLNGVSVPVTASTAKECKRQAELIKAEHRAGKRVTASSKNKPTLRNAIDGYISSREHTLSPSTIDGYRRIQKNRFQAVMDTELSEISNWQMVVDAESRVCSPKTLRNAYGLIVSVLASNGLRAPSVSFPTAVPNPRGWLEPDEITALVGAARGTQNELPVYLALHSLRRSEIVGLDWGNIDLRHKRISVSGAIVPSVRGFVAKESNKTAASTRTIPIMIPALLDTLLAVPQEERSGAVVKCSPQTVAHRINAACRSAGVPEVGTHGLRHSFASLAYHLGLSELETMEIGGWSDAGTMRKIYTHLARADRLKAENKMSDFFKNANENANRA